MQTETVFKMLREMKKKNRRRNRDKRESRKSIKDKAGERLRLKHADVDQMA